MKKKKNFYAQLIRIFRIIVLFFLICSFLLFAWGSVVINKQLKENAEFELMLFSKNCDYAFDSVFKNSLSIRDYIEDNYKKSLRQNIRLDNSGRIVEFIASQCAVMDSVTEIFVFDMKGKVFTKTGIYDEELIYDAYYDVSDNSFDKWYAEIESLRGMSTGKINVSTILNLSMSEMKAMEYMRYYEIGGQPIIVVYEMPLTSFLKGKYGNGNYGIIMPNSELFSNKNLVAEAVKAFDGKDDSNHVRFMHDGSMYVVSLSDSNTHICRYVYIQPYRAYFQYIINYGSVFLGITLFFFIISLGFMIRSSKRTVEPIKAALKEAALVVPDGQNEMMNILSSLKENNQEIVKYKGLIEEYNSKMQTVGIERILMNFIFSFEKADLYDKYKLTFPHDNYFVVIFKINGQTFDNLKKEIEELYGRICGDSDIYYNVQIGEIVASVINCDNEFCIAAEDKFETLKEAVKELYDNTLELTVSDKAISLSEIHEKYNSCLEKINIEEKFKISNQDILNTQSISNDSFEILSMCIKLGQTEYALLIFDAILNAQLCYAVDIEKAKQIFYAALSCVLLCHNDSVTKLLLDFEKYQKPTEIADYIRQVIKDISGEYVERKINKKILLQINVLKYINENLGDIKMSVACIADRFDMTPSYLSKQFKSLFDIALLEYIQKARINEAARLLLYSDLLVNEISNKLGFVNTNVFIRLFKKFVGTTPGTFRNAHTNDEA